MASTYTPALGIELIATGEQSGAWGNTTNANLLNVIEAGITATGTLQFTADANQTFNVPQNSAIASAIRAPALIFTSAGALTATRTATLASAAGAGISRLIYVYNNTTGAQSIIVKTTSGGVGVTVPTGKRVLLKLDGTDVVEPLQHFVAGLTLGTPLPVASGGTGTSSGAGTWSEIQGGAIANNAVTPNTKIDVAALTCWSSDKTTLMTVAARTKTTAGAWVVGNDQPGLGTGVALAANLTLHVFAIYDPVALLGDIVLDTSVIAANRPAAYTKFRRVGSIMLDGSNNIHAVLWQGDLCIWKTPGSDLSSTGVTHSTLTSLAVRAPLGIVTAPFGTGSSGDGNAGNNSAGVRISSFDAAETAPALLTGRINFGTETSSSTYCYGSWGPVLTNLLSQIKYYAMSAAGPSDPALYISTGGFVDVTRSLLP